MANRTTTVYAVELLGADQETVYAEIPILAPGTTRPMDAVLPPGQYSFECEAISGSSTFSAVETVKGPAVAGVHTNVPVDFSQIQLATLSYRNQLTPRLAQLASDTDTLRAAVDAGNLSQARQLWLPAHLDYERLGAAYDTFGQFGDEIDGRPNGLPGGVNDPNFQGFLRLEYGLWNGQSEAELAPVADALDAAVHQLVKQFPLMETPANDVSLRTHEILENTLQFQLTGEADEGSHTTLATALANVQGTQLALGAITSLLQARNPQLLHTVTVGLQSLAGLLASYQHLSTWTPLADLSQTQRETLDSAVSELVEQLSAIPDILELPVQPATADS